MEMKFVILLAVVAIVALYMISLFNKLVSQRNRFKNAFAQIDVQLERRYDLIPNLVEVAKKYMAHERETLEAVVLARNQAKSACQNVLNNPSDAAAVGKLSQAEMALSQTLGRFLMLTENYPDLKAQETMKSLMEELTNTENLLAFSRQTYNDSVMSYNSACQQFPANLIAGALGFSEAAFLKLQAEEKRATPKVHFS
ncbi:MAG: LemA family protein [Betaproteobacteria bacterium]|nr:LemA family protein [Betaproteobacteria bacterium]